MLAGTPAPRTSNKPTKNPPSSLLSVHRRLLRHTPPPSFSSFTDNLTLQPPPPSFPVTDYSGMMLSVFPVTYFPETSSGGAAPVVSAASNSGGGG
ncbi:hypothetical protein HanPI659440_Chr12g0455141 [Helianthus annuus]|nr:hypothetical protein HanPI659440_Chr12g0455141 [Helianthus annuus]